MSLFTVAIALVLTLVVVTRAGARLIERRHPPVGDFAAIGDVRLHHVDVPAGADADLPPLVFIHGASGNLMDQMVPIRNSLEGRARLLFVDRPGHGWSDRGAANDTPKAQADVIASLMRHRGIENAIVVGHSFGAAVAAAFALDHPGMTRGLVFLSAATHPWPGGGTSWYYRLAGYPLLGRLFCNTLAWPGGMIRLEDAARGVFAPNPMPDDYARRAAIALVLRPAAFRANAIDVEGLYRFVSETAPRYKEIAAPTVVITGNRDTVVYEDIHSGGLVRDIEGARLVTVDNLGHKPDWVAPDLVVSAIETIAGTTDMASLEATARAVETRIAGDSRPAPVGKDTESPAETALTQ